MLKYALLGLLSYDPMTGYELKQRMDRTTIHFWHAKQSQIYTTLKGMEKDGLVTSKVVDQSDHPAKRVYHITQAGKADFQKWINTPIVEIMPKKELFVLKMFFAANMDKNSQLSQLQWQLDLHKHQLEYFQGEMAEEVDNTKRKSPQLSEDVEMWEATRRFGERYEEIYIEWLQYMISLVQKKG